MSKKPKKEKPCNRPALLRAYVPGKGLKNMCIKHTKEIRTEKEIQVLMLLFNKSLKCDLFRFEVDA